MTRRGWILFIAMGIIWGLPYLLIKVAVREISPPFLVLLRTGGAALVLIPIAALRHELRSVAKYWMPLVLYTIAEMGVPWILLFHAEERLTSSLTGLLIAAVPLAGAVLAFLTGTDRLDRRRVLGLAVGFSGVALLVGFDVSHSNLWSAASVGGVVIGYAIGPWIVSRHLSEAPQLGIVAGSLLLCAVAYAPIAAFHLPQHPVGASAIWAVIALTLVCTALAFVLFFALIGEVGAYRATVITYVNPAVAVLLGVTVLGEPFGLATAAGFALIIVGCFFATSRVQRAVPAVPAASAVPAVEVAEVVQVVDLDPNLPGLSTDA